MKDESPAATASAAKIDPETLVLRGRPARVVRFRRRAIIAIAALGSAMIVGIAWMALQPATFRSVDGDDDQARFVSQPPPDALAAAPKSYGEVPQLGPPLPGDLGRPILENQATLDSASARSAGDAVDREAEAERQRLAAERKAARESGVMVRLSGADERVGPEAAAPGRALSATAEGGSGMRAAPDATPDSNSGQGKVSLLSRDGDVNPHRLVKSTSPWTLSAGSVIAASLITGLNSDLPGLVTAQVTENVYDSATGRTLLIPQGSRLTGSYDSVVAFGQERALVVWQRIILPDGSSMRLDNMPATDSGGYSGLVDEVDKHTWQLLKGVALSTLLGLGTELSIGGEGDLVRAIRETTQQNAARAGDRLVSKTLDVQPTIKVRPGWPLRIVVNKDLVLEPWRG